MHKTANLVFKDVNGPEQVHSLTDGPFRIGRLEDNDLPLDNPYISRHHVEIIFNGSTHELHDLGSTSGTFVNGRRISQHTLKDGDLIRLGRGRGIEFIFERDRTTAPLSEIIKGNTLDSDLALTPVKVIAPDDARFVNTAMLPDTADLEDETIDRLRALCEFTNDLLTAQSSSELCQKLCEFMRKTLKPDRCAVLLYKPERDMLELVTKFPPDGATDVIPTSITKRVIEANVAVLSVDPSKDERFSGSDSIRLQSIRSVMGAPIGSTARVLGVCYVDNLNGDRRFSDEELEFLTAVARQAGLMMDNLYLIEEQRRSLESFMRTLAATMDARDDSTAGHSARVAALSSALAREVGLSPADCRLIYYAGLLHDYGKIGTRDDVLLKPSELTEEEYEHIKQHPLDTFRILSKIRFPDDLSEIPFVAAAHHERLDGSGYPHGLKGEEIPFGSRIVAVADAYDALTEERVYSDGIEPEKAIAEITSRSGSYFDPKVVEAMERYFERDIKPRRPRVTSEP
jgi:putative nucleotidyltransferase with HDIG domain